MWEEASLPGAPAVFSELNESLTKPVHQTLVLRDATVPTGPRAAGRIHIPANNHLIGPSAYMQGRPARPPRNPANLPRSDYRPNIQGVAKRPGGIQSRRGDGQQSAVENTAFDDFRKGSEPSGYYTFQVTWETIIRNIRVDGMPASREARNQLDKISITTETYIPTPSLDSNKAAIYGSEAQLKHAQLLMEVFEKQVRGHAIRPSADKWVKMRALDGRKENRDERASKLQEYLQMYERSDDDYMFDFEDHIIWPLDLELEQFIADYDSSVIHEMRKQYLCRITFDTRSSFIHVSAQSEKVIYSIRSRLINLGKEMVAKANQRVKLNLYQLPTAARYRDKVGLDPDPSSGLYLMTLHGDELPEEETEQWTLLCRQIRRKNRSIVSMLLRKCLKDMQLSEMHVRMRVTFGEHGFRRHRKPVGGGDSHQFDDFCEMVHNERTLIEPQSLRSTTGDIIALADVLEKVKDFGEPTLSYSVRFDFHVPGQASTLRLETEFTHSIEEEVEVTQRRWLEYKIGSENEMLTINMLEFEKPSWQLNVGAVALYDNETTKNHLDHFAHNLGFRAPAEGIKAPAKRRAVYPPNHPRLRQVHELIMLRYPFKNTDGIFELRRTDVYDETPEYASAVPERSTWTANYYYPDWDNLLGEFAYIKPGGEVTWHRQMSSLFPDSADAKRPDGFRRFLREVYEIQDLLGNALNQLPNTSSNRQH